MASEVSKAQAENWWEWLCIWEFFGGLERKAASEAIEHLAKQFDIARREAWEDAAVICEQYRQEERNKIGEARNYTDRDYRAAGALECSIRIRELKER